MAAAEHEIEVVRGRPSVARADQIIRFLTEHAGLKAHEADGILAQVVSVALDDEGEVAGVDTARQAAIPLIGGRKFWLHSADTRPGFEGSVPALERVAFELFDENFDPGGDGPIGLCVLVTDPERMAERPEAEWSDPRMFYAGYVDGGAQVRIGYFDGAKIEPPSKRGQGSATPIADPGALPGFDIRPFDGHPAVNQQDVVEFWVREGALSLEAARARVPELVLVATGEDGELVGVSTAYVRQNEQLWMDMWHYRVFVGAAHRQSHLAVALTLATRERLKERFVTGEDTRAGGIAIAIQSPVLRRLDDAIWKATDFAYIGQNAVGDPLRVHYFPGATAPGPPGAPGVRL